MVNDSGIPAVPSGSREPSPAVSAVPASIPNAIAEQVLSMGRVEWGATAPFTDEGHLKHFAETLKITREAFNFADVPTPMHGLYLEGTETVLCHTGTSPNSGANAQALVGAWNWLVDQCEAPAVAGGKAFTEAEAEAIYVECVQAARDTAGVAGAPQLSVRRAHIRRLQECISALLAIAIEARQGGDGEAGSVHESADPKGIAQ